MTIKATIKSNGMKVTVDYAGHMSYYVIVDNVAIECHPNLSSAVSSAMRIADLGPEELKARRQYAQTGIESAAA